MISRINNHLNQLLIFYHFGMKHAIDLWNIRIAKS